MQVIVTSLAAAIYVFLLLFAAVSDVRKLKIPNWISLSVIALFIPYHLFIRPEFQTLQHIGVALLVLLVGLFLYALRWFAAGDVKLLSGLALWAGPPHIIELLFFATGFGGLMALGVLAFTRLRKFGALVWWEEKLDRLTPRWVKFGIIPYGVAISAGGLLILPSLFPF